MHAGARWPAAPSPSARASRSHRSLALLSAPEDDVIRHADSPRRLGPEDVASNLTVKGPGRSASSVTSTSVTPSSSGRPSSTSGPASPVPLTIPPSTRPLLAFSTDGFLIGTAMRPHAGVGQAQAHKTLSTGVLSHTLTFHEPCPAARVAPAGDAGHLRRARPQLRPGRHLPRRRPAGRRPCAGRHDPRSQRRRRKALRRTESQTDSVRLDCASSGTAPSPRASSTARGSATSLTPAMYFGIKRRFDRRRRSRPCHADHHRHR